MDWKVDDWCIYDLNIGQITKINNDGNGFAQFTDGSFETSGKLLDRFRPLTLRNKRLIEWFDYYYRQLDKIPGEAGFNYPRIHEYFAMLSRNAIDNPGEEDKPMAKVTNFVTAAKDYHAVIDGVSLFRPKLGA